MLIRMQARQLMVGDKVMDGDDPFLVTSVTFDDNGVNVTFNGVLEQVHPHDQILDVERQLVPDGPEMPVNRLPPGTYTAAFAGVDDDGNPVIDYATVRPYAPEPRPVPKPTFAPLERLHVGQFELVQLAVGPVKFAPWMREMPKGTWTLQLDGHIFFHFPEELAINEHHAAKVFTLLLDRHNDSVHIGYSHGVKSAQADMRRAMGLSDGV